MKIEIEVKAKAYAEPSETILRKDTRYTSGKITYRGKRYTLRGGIRTPHCIYLNEK